VKPPRIVIDTNIVIAAQRSRRGASAKLMSLVGTGLFEVHVSVPLVLEYEEILLRQRISLGLTEDDVSNLIDGFCTLAHRHKIYFLWRPSLRDKRDEMILELAVAAGCNRIITYNQKDFVGVEKFGIGVIEPKVFLQEIGVLT
jgi:putative PIN family toxin of toxin-antitoxin system